MTSRQPFSRSKRLGQDSQERHSFDEFKTTDDNRPTVAITGNGTSEEIGVHIPIGQVANPSKGLDMEVIVGSHGEDPHNKLGQLTQPESTRYKAATGEHGMQNPENAAELWLHTPQGQKFIGKLGYSVTNDKDIRHASKTVGQIKGDKAASLVSGGASIEVRDGKVYIKGQIISDQPLIVGSAPAPM